MKNVNIKVIADVICPWCFIGCSFLNKSMLKRDNVKFKIDQDVVNYIAIFDMS